MTDGSWTRYQLRQKLFSIGEDFWIENDRGEHVYRVDGKLLRIRETFVMEDGYGSELATIKGKLIAIRPTMTVERDGQVIATVKKALFTVLHEHYSVELDGGQVLEARGDITGHEYEIHSDGEMVASISKRWFTLRDTYGVAVGPDQDDVLMLAVAVCIDEMSRREHEHRPA